MVDLYIRTWMSSSSPRIYNKYDVFVRIRNTLLIGPELDKEGQC